MSARGRRSRTAAAESTGTNNDTGTVLDRDNERREQMRGYLQAFDLDLEAEQLAGWPPDAFAVCNLILDRTKAYRFVVAPPPGRNWPPRPDWNDAVETAARAWRDACCNEDGAPPPLVRDDLQTIRRLQDTALTELAHGEAWQLTCALLTLHAAADEACALLADGAAALPGSFEQKAWELFAQQGSLARVAPRRVRIVPKTNFSARGVTIRSLSRYLGLTYEPVPINWAASEQEPADDGSYRLLLLPWPLKVQAADFRPYTSRRLGNMDSDQFGFFEFAPEAALDTAVVGSLVAEANAAAGRVDAVVLPEAAVHHSEIASLERTAAEHGVRVLVAGVGGRAALGASRNDLHFGVRSGGGWTRFLQHKHHRWSLDGNQIRQYHLCRSLDPSKLWWEAIGLWERELNIISLGAGITATALVCEDLASLDEWAELVRSMGPSLVLALLLDGPQLAARWPGRYSGVIADDPGSAVLTLTCYGMVERSRPPGRRRSRVVAHWHSRADGLHELTLAPGASGLLLQLAHEQTTLWTADGRRHTHVPRLRLQAVRQLGRARGRALTSRTS
jgi:hypothetical protein